MDGNASVLQVQRSDSGFGGFHHLKRITSDTVTPQRLDWIWQRLQKCEYAFDDFTRGKVDFFLEQFTNEVVEFYEIGDQGLAILRNIIPAGGGEIHYVVWDTDTYPLNRQKISAKELLDYLFFDRRIHHAYGIIPSFNQHATRLALAIGMKYEGEIRENFLYKGKYFNHMIYGLLDSEWRVRRNRV